MTFDLLKQILFEGGKATEKYGTVRATQTDMITALKFVAKATGIKEETLADRLLGSARLTHKGLQKDSGDLDIAISDVEVDRNEVVEKMTKACGNPPYIIGGSTFSFAVPAGDKKVQVDLMFVKDVTWAKFSHFSAEGSKHKSGVRNELIHSALKYSMKNGQDLRIKDSSGNDLVRASRSYKLSVGAERLFKVATPSRKSVKKVAPEEVAKALKDLGMARKFSDQADIITDPDKFAELLFGKSVKSEDMGSTEQMIALIEKHKKKYKDEIFKDAVKGMTRLKFPIPAELEKYR